MTKLITTIVFILAVSVVTAQSIDKTLFVGNVISDTSTCKANSFYNKDWSSILKSGNKIEIRFMRFPSFENSDCTILSFNKKWSAKYFYSKPGKDSLLSKDISNKVNLDTLFARLVSNNIFSLPDQDSLKTGNYYYHPDTNEFSSMEMAVNDGIGYIVEFKVGDRYRHYSYSNPDTYADFYPHVYELRDFTNIVAIFKELLKE